MLDQGCAGSPKGSIRIQPLEPKLRVALSEALTEAGFELVDADAEPDVSADVEWRGTDTFTLRLQDAHGRLIDQASFRRSLEHCRQLSDLNWDTCWAANFERMKAMLAEPLRRSGLQELARQATHGADAREVAAPAQPAAGAPAGDPKQDPPALAEQLEPAQLQETVARYRYELQRSCWLPALEAREPRAAASARVATTIRVDPSGGVESVTTEGDPPGYPRLAACVAAQVRDWRFPPAKNPTTASIPFIFAAD